MSRYMYEIRTFHIYIEYATVVCENLETRQAWCIDSLPLLTSDGTLAQFPIASLESNLYQLVLDLQVQSPMHSDLQT